ncbi:hypothetical protein TNCV_3085231 [Trichonephila clavipes]|nr:hypothetical protein TNCV_3085231 [Trichonephila clavipes]
MRSGKQVGQFSKPTLLAARGNGVKLKAKDQSVEFFELHRERTGKELKIFLFQSSQQVETVRFWDKTKDNPLPSLLP